MVDVSLYAGQNRPHSYTSPVTTSSGGSPSITRTSTLEAGRLAILPCRVSGVSVGTPMLLGTTSTPGAPVESRPQRTIASSNPASQPRPPRSVTLTNCGCTGPRTGAFQPMGSPRYAPRQTPMPRVGSTEKERAPLSTSMMSTPSLKPPRSALLRTDQSSPRPRVSASTAKLSTQTRASASVKIHFLLSAMISLLLGNSVSQMLIISHNRQIGSKSAVIQPGVPEKPPRAYLHTLHPA